MADYIVNPYNPDSQGINSDIAGFAKQATSSTQKSPETIRNEINEKVRWLYVPPAVTSEAEGDVASLISEPQESSLLDTGILSIGDREEKAMPEENLGQDDFDAKLEEMLGTGTSRPMFKLAAERFSKGDTQGAMEAVISQKKEDVDNSNLSEKEKEKAKKDYDMFSGSPDTWLLDFGLALMACDSPYLGTCLGKAGMTAQKGARERDKAKTDKELLKLKKEGLEIDKLTASAKLLEATGKQGKDWESKGYSFVDPRTGKETNGTLMRGKGKNSGQLKLVLPTGSIIDIDPSKAVPLSTTRDLKAGESGLGGPLEKAGKRDTIKADLADRQIASLSLVGAYNDMAEAVANQGEGALGFTGELATFLDTTRAQFNALTDAVKERGGDIPLGFSTNMNEAQVQVGNSKETRTAASYINDDSWWDKNVSELAGASRQFKSAAFEMAYYALASVGQTGKAVSDFELKTMLKSIGADVGSKKQFDAASSKFLKRTLDGYAMRHNLSMKLFQEEGEDTPVFSWDTFDFSKTGGDPRIGNTIKQLYGVAETPQAQAQAPAPATGAKTKQQVQAEMAQLPKGGLKGYLLNLLQTDEKLFDEITADLKVKFDKEKLRKSGAK